MLSTDQEVKISHFVKTGKTNPLICHAFTEFKRLGVLDEEGNYIPIPTVKDNALYKEGTVFCIFKLLFLLSQEICDGASMEGITRILSNLIVFKHL